MHRNLLQNTIQQHNILETIKRNKTQNGYVYLFRLNVVMHR